MAGQRPLEDTNGKGRDRPLAQTQSQRQERLFFKCDQQSRMRAFGAQVAGDRMIQRAGCGFGQTGRRSRTDEPVQNDGNGMMPRRGDGTCHGGQLPPA